MSTLLRGRYATATAVGAHAVGDLFLLLDPSSLQSIILPASARGSIVTASCQVVDGAVTASLLVDGRSLRRGVFVDGEQVVGARAEAISAPSGGITIDSQARTALEQVLAALRQHGLIAT